MLLADRSFIFDFTLLNKDVPILDHTISSFTIADRSDINQKRAIIINIPLEVSIRAIAMDNQVLNAIQERRSVFAFLPAQVEKETLKQILDAGRWAPSWTNSQPWEFIVVTDKQLKRKIGEIGNRRTFFSKAAWMEDAAVVIVITVNPARDPYHYVEDGAIAAQNMALVAHSLGYASYYLGIYDIETEKETAEEEIRKLLEIPKDMRVIAILPIGIPERIPESSRKDLQDLVHHNKY